MLDLQNRLSSGTPSVDANLAFPILDLVLALSGIFHLPQGKLIAAFIV